jgi:hypothetical protein
MGKVIFVQFRECASDITTDPADKNAALSQGVNTNTGNDAPALRPSPLSGRAAFNLFMHRVMDLVSAGYPRIAFQEVDEALSSKRFGVASQEEALVLLREGLRGIKSGFYVTSPGELFSGAATLRSDFRQTAYAERQQPRTMIPVYGNTYSYGPTATPHLAA